MVVFFHIPKTAGTTLYGILEQQYEKIFTINGRDKEKTLQKLVEMDAESMREFDCVQGHLTFSMRKHPALKDQDLTFFSFFRDPVKWFVSNYTYVRKQQLNRFHDVALNMSMDEWLLFQKEEYYDNIQSRHLLERLPLFNPENLELDLNKVDKDELIAELFDRLNSINYVFTTDNFDSALLFLYSELSWRKKPYYIWLNASSKVSKDKLSPKTRKDIEAVNWLDMILFQEVQKREQEYLNNISDTAVEKFQKVNKNWKYLQYFRCCFK
ncbi:sulfotransferase family 2 domain-containing protein [Sulfurimonas sp. HSL1-2]|uniref:sulfotransferase family 2 domain-containing protein n=1 Tax=Thiomicrolovo zhangzhouensis TaxID=3131933 RepID=UPI0031F955F2